MTKKFNYDYTEWFLNNYKNISDDEFIAGAFRSDIYWNFLSCQWRYRLPEDFIDRFNKYLDFYELSKRKNYSDYILEKYENKWDWITVFEHIKRFDTDFLFDKGLWLLCKHSIAPIIVHHRNRIADCFSEYFPLNRVEEVEDYNLIKKLDWEFIQERKDLTREFIDKYINKMDINILLEFSNIKKLYNDEELNKFKMLAELNK